MTLIEKLEQKREIEINKRLYASSFIHVKETFDKAIDIVKQHQAESGWVSVDKRLPKTAGLYMVWYGREMQDGTTLRKYEIVWFSGGMFELYNNLITHWRELPQPPSEAPHDKPSD